jgi:hypothetical protein
VRVADQRLAKKAADAERKRKNKAQMTPERASALEGVPGWAWVADFEPAWQEKLAALRAYVGAHGALPPQSHPSSLGAWVGTQRQAKKALDNGRKGKCKMAPPRAAALEAVPGWARDAARGKPRAGSARASSPSSQDLQVVISTTAETRETGYSLQLRARAPHHRLVRDASSERNSSGPPERLRRAAPGSAAGVAAASAPRQPRSSTPVATKLTMTNDVSGR